MRAYASQVSGLVAVSLNEVPYELQVQAAMKLRERHPSLEVVLVAMHPGEALPALRVGAIDIVLSMEWECRPATARAGTTRFDLLTDRYVVALSPAHPLANDDGPLHLRDLAHERWCMTREPRFREVLERTMRTAGFETRPVFEATNAFGIAAACGIGFGIGVIPEGMGLGNIVVRPLDEPDPDASHLRARPFGLGAVDPHPDGARRHGRRRGGCGPAEGGLTAGGKGHPRLSSADASRFPCAGRARPEIARRRQVIGGDDRSRTGVRP